MRLDQIVAELKAELRRLEKAIAALTGVGSGNGRRSVGKKRGRLRLKKRTMSAAARKRLSELLKQRWASGKMGRRKAKRRTRKASAAKTSAA